MMTWTSSIRYFRPRSNVTVVNRCNHGQHDGCLPFAKMPGPPSVPVFGNTWFIPGNGKFDLSQHHVTALKLMEGFGEAVRLRISKRQAVVYLFNPTDFEAVFRQEGRSPMRMSHQALQKYRLSRPDLYNDGGLLPTNGPAWNRLRSVLQRPLSRPQVAYSYIPKMQAVTDDFILHLESDVIHRSDADDGRGSEGSVADLMPHLRMWALESVGVVALDTRFGCLGKNRDSPYIQSIMKAAYDTQDVVMVTENTALPLWKIFPTPAYKKLVRAQELLYRVAHDVVTDKQKYLQNLPPDDATGKKTVLESFLTSPELDVKDVITAATDLLFAGIDTASYSLAFILYHLSSNPEVQEKLYRELSSSPVLPKNPDSSLEPTVLSELPFLRACVKESLRLKPISIGVGRIIPTEIVLSGYKVPEGTVVVTQNQVACSLEKHFEDASKYNPDRWLPSSTSGQIQAKPHPFLVIPFGYGPRACIGRRIAEAEIYVFLIQLLRKYRLVWQGGQLNCKTSLINLPDQPINIKFDKR